MTDMIEQFVISVRADTAAFGRDVSAMRSELAGPLSTGAVRAGQTVEAALGKAIAGGKVGFADLRRDAVAALAEIAQAAVSAFGSSGQGAAAGLPLSLISGVIAGLPGRVAGGPVDRGRPYVVGERGPEIFVPGSAGRIEHQGGAKNVQVTINVAAPAGGEVQAFRQTSRQIARSLRQAVMSGR